MSAIAFLTHGGVANIGGDLGESDRKPLNDIAKDFGEAVAELGRSWQVPASILSVRQAPYLFVGRGVANNFFIFVDSKRPSEIVYRDLSWYGKITLDNISHQLRMEVGEVVWRFSLPIGLPDVEKKNAVAGLAKQYVETVLEAQRKPSKQPSEEALSHPEISAGIEKFRRDYPASQKTAFLIMQFRDTKPHKEIVNVIKDCLLKHGVTCLRADDKQYMDDLFPNIRVYMHACDFGVAVFDRITEDDFNPNVSLEVGYMLGMGKNVLLLKDRTLKSLSTDLTGKLYREFDTTDVPATTPSQIEKWLVDKGYK